MNKLALLLALLALGALGLVACGGGDDDEATAASEAQTTDDRNTGQQDDADNKPCGLVLDRWTLAVVKGDTSCRVARRVMHDFAHQRYPICCYWICDGPDGDVSCTHDPEAAARIVIRARFDNQAIRRANQGPKSDLSMRQNVEQKADEWAAAFGAGRPAWRFTGQPTGERYACERAGYLPIENCTPPPPKFRRSFADATVERVVLEDTNSGIRPIVATVEFSNGASVTFEGPHGWSVTKRWAKTITRRNFEP